MNGVKDAFSQTPFLQKNDEQKKPARMSNPNN